MRNAPAERFLFDFSGKLFPFGGRELFAVSETFNGVVGIKDHGGGHHGARKRPPARFINAGNQIGTLNEHLIVKEIGSLGLF